jgi:elongator complex protein 3
MASTQIIEELIKRKIKSRADLNSFKREVAKKYKVPCPSNIELLKAYHKFLKLDRRQEIEEIQQIKALLKTRPIRSLSGIVNISVLTKPYPCPGRCLYCPKEPGIPKSYLSGEPAVERAKRLNYDPYLQVKKRIEMLKIEGHPTDKIELRIVGGTWSYYPKRYQAWFIKECFRACNNYQSEEDKRRKIQAMASILRQIGKEQKRNEKAKNRIIGISIETRPDFINEKEIKWLRELGVTMVELGVQSIYDDVLKLNLRGHQVKETILATKLLKDAGFKILYQMMPNLPGSDLKRDEEMLEELFQNSDFRPDYLKIYPCALLKEAPLYQWWKKGQYQPYSTKILIWLLKKIKKKIPDYVRIQRISRDIPSQRVIEGGARISNLRQILAAIIKNEGWKCKCIRCREIREKHESKDDSSFSNRVYLFRENYDASDGKEIFLSYESADRKLYSLLRLRLSSKKAAIIRDVQTFGELVPIHQIGGPPQHHGLGKKLIAEAERITKEEFNLTKIAVISGIGVREYYRKLNYRQKETYMVKKLG